MIHKMFTCPHSESQLVEYAKERSKHIKFCPMHKSVFKFSILMLKINLTIFIVKSTTWLRIQRLDFQAVCDIFISNYSFSIMFSQVNLVPKPRFHEG